MAFLFQEDEPAFENGAKPMGKEPKDLKNENAPNLDRREFLIAAGMTVFGLTILSIFD